MLSLKNIKKSYITGDFKQVALNGVSLNFRESEFVAILGPSGSGKTTCLNVIGGLDKYDSGDLIINGKSTREFKDSDWDAYRNNSIGFIFQSYNLISHLSILDNVEMGMTLSGISATEKHKKAVEVLERVGLKDHIHKRPNQLSGGQMQRVAIARALANDPDIILADEPTGALDTKTSIQIMDLIKDIAKDKLVIMVTHNPELARDYADRIVEFRDGNVISDTNPLEEEKSNSSYSLKKTSMSFFTALKLSGMNIRTKKWRTFLTAFASSIGIIGIALILSLSNGFDRQIDIFESDTLSGFPIMISQKAAEVDINTMMEHSKEMRKEMLGEEEVDSSKYPDTDVIYPYNSKENTFIHTNKLTEEYVKYIEDIDDTLLSGISFTRLVNMNFLKSDGSVATPINASDLNLSSYPIKLDNNSEGYLETSYDLLAGSYPQTMNDLILVVDEYNKLDTAVLDALGIDSNKEEISFNDIVGYEIKAILNDDYYKKLGNYYTLAGNPNDMSEIYNNERAIPLKITGILRLKKDVTIPVLSSGLSYSDELSKYFIEDAKNSEVVKAQEKVDYNVFTGESFKRDSNRADSSNTNTKENILASIGATSTPYMITLYPKDFATKEAITDYLDDWNEDKDKEDVIIYNDMASTFVSLSGGIMDAITMVLIAFAAISLVVSLIMVGIITYISVLERTKEIGVLRALGARKKDITRVFNAETFIVGSCSGILGIVIAYLLTFPTNNILYKVTDLKGVAVLNPVHAIILVVISVVLTMIGGSIPAVMASKKDPVEALRTE
ncbi:MAG: ATP-binding cassette domain-containing protein [Clostridium sp.]|jgi:ABC transporter|uniref:ABC transporter ATP-binding protein/permease n=1 Tax=Clostridium sp. TaxID=1506 RepID=UPI0025D1566B|nr:ABC transporter ATP-binding protein/permease [Clostridium sp.]MCI6691077.1 ATP-binding cassette domain-containing protein [Clostridium sp.]MDY2631217.1 ATP-binding cassette domain-containing protein [Clostridium sp.]MDY4252174.1 ATP-binding cassette domain-containing protein [Clostridium sp.]MDY6228925.1 ATP-binding cassette domain-containing protein [Clostridium sp.]